MADTSGRAANRLPGLDGLRCISVLLVIAFHLSGESYFPQSGPIHALAVEGQIGVQIFFVISGFLITWLLLREEDKRGRIDLYHFYLRRVLRIIPPAFCYLMVLRIMGAYGLTDVGWHDVWTAMSFLRNIVLGATVTNHFWSLAVEEQFYLVWPILIIFLGRRGRLAVVIAAIALVPSWRYLHMAGYFGWHAIYFRRFDVACDGLLWGCLLALLRAMPVGNRWLHARPLQSRWTIPAALVIGVLAIKQPFHATALCQGFLPGMKTALTAVVLNYVVEGNRSWIERPLDAAPVVWVGRLSYSLYLWQQLFCGLESAHWFNRFPVNLLMTFAVASASFYVLEQPLARLRARLERVSTSPVMPTPWVAPP